MHGSCNLLALLPPLLLLLVAATGPAEALTDDEKHMMVELHNRYRAQASPTAANMLQMRWDDSLAAFAKAYAEQCVWGHNKERGRRGENLFAITDEGVDVPLAVEEWHHEREHYNLSAATCASGQMCGHYTQVVWAKTERIGCGSHFCEKLQGVEETNIHLLVCNYEPPGNVKGQRPYLEGTPCSQCPSGYRCENSLCEPIQGTEETQNLPDLVTEVPPSLATEASSSRKTSTPSSLATKTPSLVTEVSDSLATKTLPAMETKTPFSTTTENHPRMAAEASRSLTSEAPSFLATQSLLSLDEGPATFPRSTHDPVPKPTDKEVRGTRTTSKSPESSLLPKVFLTGTQKPPPQSQEAVEAEILSSSEILASVSAAQTTSKSPASSLLPKVSLTGTQGPLPHSQEAVAAEMLSSSEVLPSVFAVQGKPGELQATQDHMGHTSSKSLSNSPNTSATAKAKGGRTLALLSSLPGAEGPERSAIKSGLNSGPGHTLGLLLGLLLLPLLVLVGIF